MSYPTKRRSPHEAGSENSNRLGGRTNSTTNFDLSAPGHAHTTVASSLSDQRHERHIGSLGNACTAAYEAGDRISALEAWDAFCKAIKARSPTQVQRMEARMGVH